MKTFTNCAEKKAKQFLNLLQGYTKGIRMTAILILLLMGVGNAWGKIVYINVNNFQSYSSQIYVHYWNNGEGYVPASDLQNWLWMAEIPDGAKWQVLRSDGTNRYNYQNDCKADENIYHVNGWDNNGSSGYVNVFPESKYIYFDVTGSKKWNEANFNTKFNWFLVNGLYKTSTWSKNKLSDGKYYTQVPENHLEQIQLCRMDPNNDGSQWNYTNNATVNNEYNCLYVPNDRLDWENTWVPAWKTYAPPMSSVTLTDNGTNIISGQGTSTNPYLVEVGTPIKVRASGTKEIEDPAATINYNFKQGNTSKQNGTNDTYSFNASSTSNTSYTINLESYTKISSVSGTSKSATALYYKTTTTEKEHNVTVSHKCGTATIDDNTTKNVGEDTPTTITAPDIYGYTFKSWELGSGINQKSVNGKSITITTKATGNYTLTAKYDEDLSTEWSLAHSIDNFNTSSHKFTKNTGESAGKVAYVSIDLASNANYQFKVVNGSTWYGNNNNNNGETYWIKNTVENWEFYDNAGNCHMKSSVAGTYTFKIDFSGSDPKVSVYFPTSYTVTYGVGNNEGTDAVTTNPNITSGSLVLASTSITFSKGTTKAGYTWKNWNSKADGTGTNLGTGDIYVSSNRAADITVYACYDLITYNITYNLNSGSGATNTTYNVTTATITLPTPSKTGYTFAGWYDNEGLTGNAVTQITKGSTGHKVFWAKWEANTYTVIFNKNANDATGTMTNQSFTYDEAAKALTANTFTRTGYTFAGWATSQNGAVIYTDQQSVSNLTSTNNGTVNLYAQWTVNQYDINYRDQGDSDFSGTHENGYPQKHTYGTATELKTATKQGYEFGGWFTTSDCTGDAITSLGATAHTNAITLYAKWIQQYVIVGNGNGSWLNGHSWIGDGTVTTDNHNIIQGSKTYKACPAGLKNFRIVPWGVNSWGKEHGFDQIDHEKSSKIPYYTNEDNNIAFVTVAKADITIGFDVANNKITIEVNYNCEGADLESVKSSIVSGENVMFYFGDELTDRTRQYLYVNELENSTDNHVVTETKGFLLEGVGAKKWLAVAILRPKTYNISNDPGWGGVSTKEVVQAGAIYAWYGNQVMGKTDGVTPKWESNLRVQVGHTAPELATCGQSSIKQDQTIEYYYKNGENWEPFELNDVSTWEVGAYEVHALAYDGNIYVRTAESATLTIYDEYTFTLLQAEGGNATATVNGNAISSPETLEHGTQITLNATAADKYKFSKWVNGNGAQVSTDNPYTHTLTANTTIQAVFTNTDVLYLKPNNNWKSDYAWFAACFCKTGSTDQYWVKMKDDDPCSSNGYYKAQIPEGDWDYVIFCRMNKDQHELKWDNRWDQTKDVTLPTDGKNCYTITEGQWGGHNDNNNGATGNWSIYTSTHQPLVYNVTVPAGTPNCYIIGSWDGWVQFTEMTKVDDTHYTVSIPDACENHGYKYCYGPSWGCEEVANTDLPTTTIADREYKSQDKVKAWIKYCLVGQDIGWNWNNDYSFDVAGNMSHDFNAKNHNIKVMSSTEKCYTHNEYTYNLHRSHTSVKIPHEGGNNNDLILQADLTGTYKFHFDPVNWLLTIEFPSKGYRLKITMTDGSGKVYTSNEVNNETETLSFFAPGSDDSKLSADITLEYQGRRVADIPSTLFKASEVYTAKLNSDNNGITDVALYDGNYYIRTDGANGGWNSYKTNSDNKMTYFVPREEEKYSYYWVAALPQADRNESNGVVNVKACVANEYNENLAVMLEADKFTDGYGNVTIKDPSDQKREKINVRFGYNPKTNHFERAMLTGSGNMPNFLNITDPEGFLYKTNNQGTLETPLTTPNSDNKFTDVSNWVYERDVWVDVQGDKDVTVCLTAVAYNEETNSLFGFDDADPEEPTQRTIVGKTSTQSPKKMRIIYDFKTNRMIMAWMPGDYECDKEEALIADVLFMRHENDPVPQLTMRDTDDTDQITPQIKGIQTQFFALELENKQNNGGNYEEHYWITLPFNCVVGSISGVPGYMTVWGIQRYDGAERAQKGWFKETETFWKWLGPDDVMEAGVGYVLSFDKSAATWNTFDVHTENADGSITTTQKSLLRLYFPSTEKGFTFKSTNSFEKEYPNEPCTIQREDRYKQDGNWKIIGPISYNSATADPEYKTGEVWKPEEDGDHVDVSGKWSQPMFRYRYEYDNSTANYRKTKWKYIPEDGEKSVYQAFYGYLVQFAGLIKWSEISQSIHPRLRARTYTDQMPTNITTHLELVDADGVQHDQTFVALDVEGTTTYDLNKDLNKAFNSNFANIYTLSEGIPFAGNTLPMEKATVPVGVRTATAGEYTFRMPDGTNGISVTLVDNATGTHTNMLMDEYTVTLDAGTIENRFYLVVDPDRTATSVENVGDEAKGQIKKFLIDGKLFIRTADGIFDAKGQRM